MFINHNGQKTIGDCTQQTIRYYQDYERKNTMGKLFNSIQSAINVKDNKPALTLNKKDDKPSLTLSTNDKSKTLAEQGQITIESFDRIERLSKQFGQFLQIMEALTKKIEQTDKDHVWMINTLKKIDSHTIENNGLIGKVYQHVSGIKSINEVKVIKKDEKPETITTVETIPTDAMELIEKLYIAFMDNFGLHFAGSKKPDQLADFQAFISHIDDNDIAGSIGKANQSRDQGYYFAIRSTKAATTALETAINSIEGKQGKPIEQGNGKVIDKKYWSVHYGVEVEDIEHVLSAITGADLTDKNNVNQINAHIDEIKTTDNKDHSKFIAWLGAFKG